MNRFKAGIAYVKKMFFVSTNNWFFLCRHVRKARWTIAGFLTSGGQLRVWTEKLRIYNTHTKTFPRKPLRHSDMLHLLLFQLKSSVKLKIRDAGEPFQKGVTGCGCAFFITLSYVISYFIKIKLKKFYCSYSCTQKFRMVFYTFCYHFWGQQRCWWETNINW